MCDCSASSQATIQSAVRTTAVNPLIFCPPSTCRCRILASRGEHRLGEHGDAIETAAARNRFVGDSSAIDAEPALAANGSSTEIARLGGFHGSHRPSLRHGDLAL